MGKRLKPTMVKCVVCGGFKAPGETLPTCNGGRVCDECDSQFVRRSHRGKEIPLLFEALRNGTPVPNEAMELIDKRERRIRKRLNKEGMVGK